MPGILDEIKAGLNSLLDKVAGDDEPIPERTAEEIRRLLRARAEGRAPLGDVHPIARRASASAAARRARERLARTREQRIRERRAKRAAAEQAARDAAFEQARRQAEREARAAGARGSGATGRTAFTGRRDPELAKHYETLNLPYGAPFSEVKQAFRRLMRKYHPDMHAGSPDKQRAAAELTKKLTVAYNALERHFSGS
ncbi:MAG: J domain-containing protein [Deltaproteobacteria bacterium]|nr:MAG: J domain-containing protein [Deltaproteobacteria bacterium]